MLSFNEVDGRFLVLICDGVGLILDVVVTRR